MATILQKAEALFEEIQHNEQPTAEDFTNYNNRIYELKKEYEKKIKVCYQEYKDALRDKDAFLQDTEISKIELYLVAAIKMQAQKIHEQRYPPVSTPNPFIQVIKATKKAQMNDAPQKKRTADDQGRPPKTPKTTQKKGKLQKKR